MVREVIATGADVGEAREKALEMLGENLPENIDVDFGYGQNVQCLF